MYITRLASNTIFSPSNKIHREVGGAKDLSAPRYCLNRTSSIGCGKLSVFEEDKYITSCSFYMQEEN